MPTALCQKCGEYSFKINEKYNKTNKELSEAQASEFSGESKAERQWETLKDGSSQPTERSSKRKQGSKD